MITVKEMKQLEHQAVQNGISLEKLMENAGKEVFEVVRRKYQLDDERIVIFCGKGNNAGDGFVTARYFHENGNSVVVLFFGYPDNLSEEVKVNYDKIKDKVNILQINEKEDVGLFKFQEGLNYIFIDALLGTGVVGDLREPINFAIDFYNLAKGIKVSVDIPSGINLDTGEGEKHCQFDLIICLHDIKQGLEKFKDQVEIVDIGI